MNEFKVGDFNVHISGPYPVFVRIERFGRELIGIHHSDLADLAYAVKRAMRDSRKLLGDDAKEC